MKGVCPHCNGNHLVRQSIYRHYKNDRDIGIRYLCRDCKRTHMIRVNEKDDAAHTKRNATIPCGPDGGRPTRVDWRFA